MVVAAVSGFIPALHSYRSFLDIDLDGIARSSSGIGERDCDAEHPDPGRQDAHDNRWPGTCLRDIPRTAAIRHDAKMVQHAEDGVAWTIGACVSLPIVVVLLRVILCQQLTVTSAWYGYSWE